jgi:hypothetical protein
MLQKLLDEEFRLEKLRKIQEIKRKYDDEVMNGLNKWVTQTKVRKQVIE